MTTTENRTGTAPSADARRTPGPPPEVVTRAVTRIVDVPRPAGSSAAGQGPLRFALITVDNGKDHTRPSTFGPQGLASLDAAIDVAFAARPDAVAVTGKPFVFAVGADLSQVGGIGDRAQAAEFVTTGQRVFGRLRTSDVPTFAFVNGAAMGGGMELPLHCHYRSVASNAAALAQPEVFLGILPGWGGSQLIPRLAGPGNAVTLIVENALNQNRMLKPADALALGMVDVVLDAADFLEESLRWAARIVTGEIVVERTAFAGAGDAEWTEALERGKAVADLRTRGAAPAAYRALDAIALSRTTDLDAGLATEADLETDLIMSDEFRASVYSFQLTQQRAKKPVGAPDPKLARRVTSVGVVGAGLMAGQLALLFARRLKVPVVLTELDQGRLDKGLARIHREIDGLLRKKRIGADEANRIRALISGSLDRSAYADADFVVEAVFEEMAVKKQVLAQLEQHVRPDAVLATNTSSLSITEMASDLRHPERVVGFHFFNPVAVMPLLEIIRGERTDDVALATAFGLAKPLRKGPILVQDGPGFVVNRLLLRLMGEVFAAMDEGTPFAVADAALDPLGLPMSPLMLLQLTGPAVAQHVAITLRDQLGERFPVSENLQRIVDAGHTTILTWDENGRQVLDPEVAALWRQGENASTADEVRERALRAVAVEARGLLDEGIVAEPADIDLGMLTGAGFPFWLGGITPYLDRTGVSERAVGRRFLPPGVASLPTVSSPGQAG